MKQVTVIKNNFDVLPQTGGTALVVGNFEGVHKGHQALLKKLVQVARSKQLTPCVYTFYPHPKKFFNKAGAPKRLMSLSQKVWRLCDHGIEAVVTKPFTSQFASMTFDAFLNHLKNDLNVKYLLVGEDFAFGKNREGTVKTLQEYAPKMGFEVEVVQDVLNLEDQRYSSTLVRDLLASGQVKAAGYQLGFPVCYKTYLYEDDFCNLVAHLNGYSAIKNGVYFMKVEYTAPVEGYESAVVPARVENSKAYIAPLPQLPNLVEGRVYLSLIDKIEK
tara:strand:- start:4082 stop:4903 length:822 start_codon:yes stop_codon:yes gene_type:complete